MRLFLLLLLVAAPLCAQSEVERLTRDIGKVRAEIAALKKSAGPEEPELASRLREHCFSWTTDDGKFALRMEVLTQFTVTYHDVRANGGQGQQADNGRDFWNARVPYLRVQFTGNIFDSDFLYKAEIVPVGEDGRFGLEEVWFRWQPAFLLGLLNVTAGQMRAAWSYEELVERSRRAFAQRSVSDKAFSQGFAKGVNISGAADLWSTRVLQWNVAVHNGVAPAKKSQGSGQLVAPGGSSQGISVTEAEETENLANGFRNQDNGNLSDSFDDFVDADLLILARLELHALGEMARTGADMRSFEESLAWKFMVAMAVAYFTTRTDGNGTFLGNAFRPRQVGFSLPPPGSGRKFMSAEILTLSVDGHFRGFGFFVNWALYYRHVEFHNHGRLQNSNTIGPFTVAAVQDTGLTVEAGYYIAVVRTLIALRVSAVNFDEFGSTGPGGVPVDGDAFGPDTMEYGGAATWCIHGDHLKLVFEYRYVVQQMPHGVDREGSGLQGTRRVSDYRNFQEFRVMIQWIF